MNQQRTDCLSRPKLKTRGFSTLHIDIFEYILRQNTNREINEMLGYTKKSHIVVDHSRKVMYKLLALENLPKREYADHVIYPRNYCFWWKKMLDQHRKELMSLAIKPEYYID